MPPPGASRAPDQPRRPDPAGQATSARGRFTNLLRIARVDSTNGLAAELAARGAAEGLVVVAREQWAGRGRRGRSWVGPPGAALLCSVLLRPPLPLEQLQLAVAALALAAREAVAVTSGLTPGLKWPNDLLVPLAGGGEGKLAGVLAEAVPGGGLVVGIGCNLDRPPGGGAASLPEGAACLREVTGRRVAEEDLLEPLLGALERRYGPLVAGREGALAGLAAERREACVTLGRKVRVELAGGEQLAGLACDLSDDGRLLLELEGGGRRLVEAGDLVHLRPAP